MSIVRNRKPTPNRNNHPLLADLNDIKNLQRQNDLLEEKLKTLLNNKNPSPSACAELSMLFIKTTLIIIVLCAAVVCYQVIHHQEPISNISCECPYQQEFVPLGCDLPEVQSTENLLNDPMYFDPSETQQQMAEKLQTRLKNIISLENQLQRMIELVNQRHAELKKNKESISTTLTETKKILLRLLNSVSGERSSSTFENVSDLGKKEDWMKLAGIAVLNWIIFAILSPKSSKIAMIVISFVWFFVSVLALAWELWLIGILAAANGGLQFLRILFS